MVTYQKALTALADPTRRDIFESLRDAPRTVGELATGRPVSRPAVSQHLKVLKAAGLVDVVPQGSRHMYAVRREGLDVLRRYLDTFWAEALDAYGEEIKRRKRTKEGR